MLKLRKQKAEIRSENHLSEKQELGKQKAEITVSNAERLKASCKAEITRANAEIEKAESRNHQIKSQKPEARIQESVLYWLRQRILCHASGPRFRKQCPIQCGQL